MQTQAACPHAAARQTQRLPVSIGQHKRVARRGVRRRDNTKARDEICLFRFAWLKGTDADGTSTAERIPKPWVLAAFFGYFLPLLAESTPPEAQRGGITDRHSRCAHRLRNDTVFYKGCGG